MIALTPVNSPSAGAASPLAGPGFSETPLFPGLNGAAGTGGAMAGGAGAGGAMAVAAGVNPVVAAAQAAQARRQQNQVAAGAGPEAQAAEQGKLLQNSIISGNIPQMVTSALSQAVYMRSSDIHIEPLQNRVRLRYRVDGVLREIVEYPSNIHPAVVSRIKIMANLKIDEQRIPQDGRAQLTTPDGRQMDMRVSTLPTVNGEKVVMRVQERTKKIPPLQDLGLSGVGLSNLKKSLALPNGIILTSGPTGSGKTTTLYSSMQILNKIDVNILTFEDPVEIQMDGLNQSQMHADIEYNFARGLRAALRQDPDIMMVGEIRDRETIDVAIEASLTGHLVLSTIHTNSAVETLTRILNMGVPPFLMTATINTIIAQRLVRKLCDSCKKPAEIEEATRLTVTKALERLSELEQKDVEPGLIEGLKFFEAAGCDQCDNIGFKGRLGLYEVLQMSNALRVSILKNATDIELEEQAIKAGMTTLEQSGILAALRGQTTLNEVYRVARPME